jgi:hypothetical protein
LIKILCKIHIDAILSGRHFYLKIFISFHLPQCQIQVSSRNELSYVVTALGSHLSPAKRTFPPTSHGYADTLLVLARMVMGKYGSKSYITILVLELAPSISSRRNAKVLLAMA